MTISSLLASIKLIAHIAVDLAEAIVTGLTDLVKYVAMKLVAFLSSPIDIPGVSYIYEYTTGDKLPSALSVCAFVLSVPFTFFWKVLHGGAEPFPDEENTVAGPQDLNDNEHMALGIFGLISAVWGLASDTIDFSEPEVSILPQKRNVLTHYYRLSVGIEDKLKIFITCLSRGRYFEAALTVHVASTIRLEDFFVRKNGKLVLSPDLVTSAAEDVVHAFSYAKIGVQGIGMVLLSNRVSASVWDNNKDVNNKIAKGIAMVEGILALSSFIAGIVWVATDTDPQV
jgi:hypothetical protein